MTFLPAPILRLRYIVLLVYCRKSCKNWRTGISRIKHWGMPRTFITNCLQTKAVHRNRNAACDYALHVKPNMSKLHLTFPRYLQSF